MPIPSASCIPTGAVLVPGLAMLLVTAGLLPAFCPASLAGGDVELRFAVFVRL